MEVRGHMRDLNLDASTWKNADDFYSAFFKAVGAPEWHGRNFNALDDSIAHGRINEIEVPYRIVIRNTPSRNYEIGLLLRDFENLRTRGKRMPIGDPNRRLSHTVIPELPDRK